MHFLHTDYPMTTDGTGNGRDFAPCVRNDEGEVIATPERIVQCVSACANIPDPANLGALIDAGHNVLASWEGGDLAAAVRDLSMALEDMPKPETGTVRVPAAALKLAREMFASAVTVSESVSVLLGKAGEATPAELVTLITDMGKDARKALAALNGEG